MENSRAQGLPCVEVPAGPQRSIGGHCQPIPTCQGGLHPTYPPPETGASRPARAAPKKQPDAEGGGHGGQEARMWTRWTRPGLFVLGTKNDDETRLPS